MFNLFNRKKRLAKKQAKKQAKLMRKSERENEDFITAHMKDKISAKGYKPTRSYHYTLPKSVSIARAKATNASEPASKSKQGASSVASNNTKQAKQTTKNSKANKTVSSADADSITASLYKSSNDAQSAQASSDSQEAAKATVATSLASNDSLKSSVAEDYYNQLSASNQNNLNVIASGATNIVSLSNAYASLVAKNKTTNNDVFALKQRANNADLLTRQMKSMKASYATKVDSLNKSAESQAKINQDKYYNQFSLIAKQASNANANSFYYNHANSLRNQNMIDNLQAGRQQQAIMLAKANDKAMAYRQKLQGIINKAVRYNRKIGELRQEKDQYKQSSKEHIKILKALSKISIAYRKVTPELANAHKQIRQLKSKANRSQKLLSASDDPIKQTALQYKNGKLSKALMVLYQKNQKTLASNNKYKSEVASLKASALSNNSSKAPSSVASSASASQSTSQSSSVDPESAKISNAESLVKQANNSKHVEPTKKHNKQNKKSNKKHGFFYRLFHKTPKKDKNQKHYYHTNKVCILQVIGDNKTYGKGSYLTAIGMKNINSLPCFILSNGSTITANKQVVKIVKKM